jgi:LPS sulfotransferase NodH
MSGSAQASDGLFDYWDQFTPRYDFPDFVGTPRLYVIATTPRSGSHFLGHALWESGAFGAPLEYLHRKNFQRWQERSGADSPEAVFGWLARRRTSPSGWFGLKLMWRQFETWAEDGRLPFLQPVARVIHLYRRDLLGQAISFRIAQQTGVWAAGMPGNGREAAFDRAAILQAAEALRRQNRDWHRMLNSPAWAGVPRFSLAYEDLAGDPGAMLGRIARFLEPDDPPPLAPTARTARQSDGLNADWRRRVTAGLERNAAWVTRAHDWQLDRPAPSRWRRRLALGWAF